jgi:hypothetical protein
MSKDPEQWHLPKKFQPSPEVLAAADAAQQNWAAAANMPFANIDGKTREKGLALTLLREYSSYGFANLGVIQLLEMGEAYATLGRFDEAATVAKKAKRYDLHDDYLRIWAAVWRPDEGWCGCDITKRYVEKDIWSIKHNEERPLLRCSCGFVNVSDLPKEIEQQRAMRSEAQQLTKGLSLKQSRRVLEAHGHTNEKLFAK